MEFVFNKKKSVYDYLGTMILYFKFGKVKMSYWSFCTTAYEIPNIFILTVHVQEFSHKS